MRERKIILKSLLYGTLVLILATGVSFVIQRFTMINNSNIIAVYILAIMLISSVTDGYIYGIVASVFCVLLFNYFFTYPFTSFNFWIEGYPITFIIMFVIAILTSALVTKIKKNGYEAYINEKKAKALLEKQHHMSLEAEREKMQGNLLRAISHDLRTPLTAISGSASAIRDNQAISKTDIDALANSIYEDSNWLIQMVENLLAVTRLSDTQVALKKAEEAVEEVVPEAVQRVRKQLKTAKIMVNVPAELLLVPMDSTLIEQVLMNLIENAVKYSHSSDPVRVTVWSKSGRAYFEVRDSGVGINDAAMSDLFDVPLSGGGGDTGRGMGIGLSLCKTIIKAHGGEISARNEDGAVFTFWLPLNEEDELS